MCLVTFFLQTSLLSYIDQDVFLLTTDEPVLSGTVLSGHPLLSGELSKPRKLLPLFTVILTCIKRSPLLSGRGHPKLSPNELISIVLTCFKVTRDLQRCLQMCLASKRCSASGLNCRYLNPYIKLRVNVPKHQI